MKKTWTLILSVCLAVCALCSGFALTSCDSERKKLDLTISNYAEYDGLMAGVPSDSYVSPAAKTVFRAEAYKDEKKKMPKLYGRRKDGSYEQIEFEEENDITTKYGLYNIQQVGGFIFLIYAKNYTREYGIPNGFYSDCNPEQYCFLLDTRTGKLFDMSEYRFCGLGRSQCGMVNGELYCKMPFSVSDAYFRYYLCKISVNGNELSIERIIDLEQMSEFEYFSLDKYGNIFSERGQKNYIYNRFGIVKKLDQPFLIAANGIAYLEKQTIDEETGETVSSWGEWINSEGEKETAEFIPEGLSWYREGNYLQTIGYFDYRISCIRELGFGIDFIDYNMGWGGDGSEKFDDYGKYLYQEDNTYYGLNQNDDGYYGNKAIIKYEFIDDVRYEVEFIDLEKCERYSYNGGDNTVYAGERVYFLNSEEVYYINMKDGSAHTLSSGYIFKKIYSDNQGGIIFEGLDERLNTVTGMIGADDSVTVGITPREYEIFYIASLN